MFLHCLHGTSDDKQDYQKKTHPNVKILEKYKKPEVYQNFSEAIREVMRADHEYRTFIEENPLAHMKPFEGNRQRTSDAVLQAEEDMRCLGGILDNERDDERGRAIYEEYEKIVINHRHAKDFLRQRTNFTDINPEEEKQYFDIKQQRKEAFNALAKSILPETSEIRIRSVLSIIFQTNSAKVSENTLPSEDIEIWKNIGDFGAISQVCKDFNQASVHEFFNYYLAKYCQGKLFKDIKPYLLLKNKNLLKADNQFDRTLEIMEKKLLKDSDFDIIRDIIRDIIHHIFKDFIHKAPCSIDLKYISEIKNRDGMVSSIDQLKDALLQHKGNLDFLKDVNDVGNISRYDNDFKQVIYFLNTLKKKFEIDNPNSSSSSSSK